MRLLSAAQFGVVSLAAARISLSSASSPSVFVTLSIMSLGLLLALAIWRLPWDHMAPWQSGVTGLASLIVILAMVMTTGGTQSPLQVVFFVVPVAGAILFPLRWMYIITGATAGVSLIPFAVEGAWHLFGQWLWQATVMVMLAAVAFILVTEVRRLYREQRFLQIASEITQLEPGTDINAFLRVSLMQFLEDTELAFAAVALQDCDGAHIWSAAAAHRPGSFADPDAVRGTAVSADDWFVGRAIYTRQPQLNTDLFSDPRHAAHPLFNYRPSAGQAAAAIATPLMARGRVLGVLFLMQDRADAFHTQHVALTQLIAGHLAAVLDNRQLLDEASRQARLDPLTGVYNRRYLQERLTDLTEAAHALARPLSLIFCDIRFFKQFNDSYGHTTGDNVLRGLAHVLRTSVRDGDIVTRYGGDEFVILLPDTTAAEAATICDRVRQRISLWNDQRLAQRLPAPVEVTLGVRTAAGLDANALLHAADMAMFEARTDVRE